MSEELVRHIAREYDRLIQRGEPVREHPDENAWALLADNLMSISDRAELLRHASECAACRRRLAIIVGELEPMVGSAGAIRPAAGRIIRLPHLAPALAAAAVLAFAVGVGLYTSTVALNPSLLSADAALTTLGVALQKPAPPTDATPMLAFAEYQRIMGDLAPTLRKLDPPAPTLALATRASLSARDYPQALRFAGRWRDAAPADPSAQNAFGMASFLLDKMSDARLAFEKAARLAPEHPEYQLNAALAADRSGKPDEAKAYLLKLKAKPVQDVTPAEIEAWLQRLER